MIEFVKIPAGQFIYGKRNRRSYLGTFWISKIPITNVQYQIFVKETGYLSPRHWYKGDKIPPRRNNHPVLNVSWDDAQQFCKWAGLRLPMEREWEKAARGVDGRTYPWGYQEPTAALCNFNNYYRDTTPVDQFPQGASPYGCLDVAGNVWEWCEEVHEHGGHVLRGGSFNYGVSAMPCTTRYRSDIQGRAYLAGFRCVAENSPILDVELLNDLCKR